MLTVAVVVPSKDRAASLARLLVALERQHRLPDQVVVVDDGSSDGTAAMLAARDGITVLRNEVSVGPAAARNRGIAAVYTDLVAFTDDDCVPAPDWLAGMVAAFEAGADVVLGRTTADPDAFVARGPWDHAMVTSGADPMFSTCNIGYRTDLLRNLGGFDEDFVGTRGGAQWGEDTDLGLRAVELGATAAFDESVVVEHDVVPRGWWAYCLAGLRRTGVPRLVVKHPDYREHLTFGIFLNEAHAWAPLALVGLAAGGVVARQAPLAGGAIALIGALPWTRFRTRVWPVQARRRALPYVLPLLWAADLMETLVVVAAAGKSRILVV